MITQIKTVKGVQVFAKQLIAEGVSFHPDDDFKDYVYYGKNKRYYSDEEAEVRNNLMLQCFNVCERKGIDIYGLMLEVTLKETGMDKYIPLPSAALS